MRNKFNQEQYNFTKSEIKRWEIDENSNFFQAKMNNKRSQVFN